MKLKLKLKLNGEVVFYAAAALLDIVPSFFQLAWQCGLHTLIYAGGIIALHLAGTFSMACFAGLTIGAASSLFKQDSTPLPKLKIIGLYCLAAGIYAAAVGLGTLALRELQFVLYFTKGTIFAPGAPTTDMFAPVAAVGVLVFGYETGRTISRVARLQPLPNQQF